MGCPPVREDNSRALASGLSYVQVDNRGVLFYTTYMSVDLAHHEIIRAKAGKGVISNKILNCGVIGYPTIIFEYKYKLFKKACHLSALN